MIRVFIVADSSERADSLGEQLEEDQRFEVSPMERADVILCVGIGLGRLPHRRTPIVSVSADLDGDAPFDDRLRAWLPASATLDQITAALLAAAAGLTILTRAQSRRAFHIAQTHEENSPALETLTAREMEVLQMMATGLGNKEIAARLRISTNTAKFHVAQILAKLGATSRTQAVSLAVRRGAVSL